MSTFQALIDDSQSMKLIIVRHGATDYNLQRLIQGQLDIPLNAKGRQQAQELAWALAQEAIDRIYSSDLCRARQTTAAIARTKPCAKVEYNSALRERHYGEWQSKPVSRLRDAIKSYAGNWESYIPAGGESLQQFHRRVGDFWHERVRHHKGESILLSAHGGVTKSLITHILGEDLTFRSSLVQDNCCMNILSADTSGGGFSIQRINSIAHLSSPTGLEGL